MRLLLAFLVVSAFFHKEAFGDVYTDAGCKPANQVWSASDYETFVALLISGKVPLPQPSDSDGAKLLSRLCSEENLLFCTDKNATLGSRFGRIRGILMVLAEVQKHILNITDKERRVGPVFAMTTAFSLRVQMQAIRLSKEYQGEAQGEMKQWIAKFYTACGAMMARSHKILATDGFSSPEHYSLLLSAIADSAPDFASIMSANQRRDAAKSFQAVRAKFASTQDMKAIDEIVSALGLE